MGYQDFHDLVAGYLDSLRGRPCHGPMTYTAKPWILTLDHVPTRKEILARHRARGTGDYQPGAPAANAEIVVIRAAIRWGLYQEVWEGHDPTVGVKPWKAKKRKAVFKHHEFATLLAYFHAAKTDREIRDRALYGLCLCTGARPIEARQTKLEDILPYGSMGCWKKKTTKNGQTHEIPIPTQLMSWIDDWRAIRPSFRPNPYLFLGQSGNQPLGAGLMQLRWCEIVAQTHLTGLWNYDLRRSITCYLHNELDCDRATVEAILNHEDGGSLGHYLFKSFDSLCKPIQQYADWLWSLSEAEPPRPMQPEPVDASPVPAKPVSPPTGAVQADERAMRALSQRERAVLARLASGELCRAIAVEMKLSHKTVEGIRLRLREKLNIKTTNQLIRYAMEHEGETTGSTAAPPTPPVIVPVAMSPMMPAPRRGLEREEWPG